MTKSVQTDKSVATIFQRLPLLILVTTLLLSTIACASSGAPAAEAPMDSMAYEPAAEEMAAYDGELAEDVGMVDQTAAAPGYQDGVALTRKIIARATMSIVVEDTQAVVDSLQAQLNAIGGYVANANLYRSSYGDDERLQGTMTVRIPAAELETVMADLQALAVSVQDKTINREDVTDQYSDTQARIRNLEATENELREMLAEVRAKPDATPEDILTVYRHLTDIRGQIEQAQGRKNMFDNLVGLSTLDLTLTPNWSTRPVVEAGWQPGATLRNASRELVGALQGLAAAGIWFVVFLLPILVLLAIPVALVVWLLRRTVRWLRGRRRQPVAVQPAGE